MRGKLAFLAIWTPLMGLSVWWLFFQKSHETATGTPLARVTSQVGEIQHRQEDDILWRSAEKNQYVFENDHIATGQNSYATINFGNSRMIELGPNTQIRIRPVGTDSKEFELELLRGQVAARPGSENDEKVKASKKPMQLRIITGKESFSLKRQSELVLKKERAQNAAEVLFAHGKISHSDSNGSKDISEKVSENKERVSLAALVKDTLEVSPPPPKPAEPEVKPIAKPVVKITPLPPPLPPTPAPTPLPPPAPAPKPVRPVEEPKMALTTPGDKVIDFLPTLVFPPPGSIVWSTLKWSDLLAKPLQLVVEPPNKKPDTSWQPVIASSTKHKPNERVFILQGKDEFRRQILGLKLDKLRNRGFLKQESSEEEYQIELAAGVRLTKGKDVDQASTATRTFRIRSSQTVPKSNAGLKIRMARLSPQVSSSPWFVTPETFTETASLYLKDKRDLARVQPLVIGSNGVSIENSENEIRGSGVFVVRDSTVVAKINGGMAGGKTLDRIRKMLKAEAIYRGPATAYIGGLTQFKERALAKKLPEKIFLLHSGRFIGVSRDFMQTNPTLRKFLEQQTSAFFTEPIEILSAENFKATAVSH